MTDEDDKPSAMEAASAAPADKAPIQSDHIAAWEARALTGMKRTHHDEADRLSLNSRLS